MIAQELASRGHALCTPDLPGHGRSATLTADLWQTAELLANTIDPSTIVGYSMGGRIALHLALLRPNLVQRLVLIGATAGIEDNDDREARRADDAELATRIEAIGVAAFLSEWLGGPLFASLPASHAGSEHRLTNTTEGLANSLRRCGTGSQALLWDRLSEIQCPVTLVVGGLDQKFTALASRMQAVIGQNAELRIVDRAGHACHLEDPARFLEVAFE